MPLHDCFTKYRQLLSVIIWLFHFRGRRCRDRMVVGFTTTYAISAYHYQYSEFESVYDNGYKLRLSGWCFLQVTLVSFTDKTDRLQTLQL
jgi:hypothetical protein